MASTVKFMNEKVNNVEVLLGDPILNENLLLTTQEAIEFGPRPSIRRTRCSLNASHKLVGGIFIISNSILCVMCGNIYFC